MSKGSPVFWLPGHPLLSGTSMQRYWYFLQQAADRAPDFRVDCILGRPAEISGTEKGGRLRKAWTKYVSYPVLARRSRPDAVHHILDHAWAHLVRSLPRRSAKIMTVHDLIPFRFPDGLTKSQVERCRWVIGHVRNCDAVIADSSYTKSEIQHFFGVREELIHVIPLGVAAPAPAANPPTPGKITSAVRQGRLKGGELMVGCLGSAQGRKNLAVMVQAVERLRARGMPVMMVRAGPPPSGALAAGFAALQAEGGLIDLGFISDEEVHEFYANVDALCMPSLYEGFGLPVIEAMGAGVPVVCSSTTSLPEVAGDAALMFDPLSAEELETHLESLFDPGIRADLARRGVQRAAGFTWDSTLENCRRIYQKF